MFGTILVGLTVVSVVTVIIMLLCMLGEVFFDDPGSGLVIPFIIIFWLGIFYFIGSVIQGVMK